MANVNVRTVILAMFYNATICGVWMILSKICWGGTCHEYSERDRYYMLLFQKEPHSLISW